MWYDLCTGHDAYCRLCRARAPAGVVRTGMYVRLVNGTFFLVEKVERRSSPRRTANKAAEVVERVWVDDGSNAGCF